MILFALSDPQPNKNKEGIKVTLNILTIKKSGQQDTFQLKEDDF
jgi:hypothetical protein